MTNAGQSDDLGARTRRHITRRLMPFLFVLYIFNYLNRVNVGYAALQMRGDLGFSNTVFGFGAGIFFIGYFLLQIPSTLVTELWSARKFITLSLVVWGTLAALCGLVNTAQQFYWVRFFLGIAQAGFFPGIIVYLTHWFRYEDRAKAVAMFMMAIPTSNMVGAGISAALMRIDWLGMNGWRWLLILEGLPTVALGVVAFFYLTDRPKDARWLPEDERQWISDELERESERKKSAHKLSTWQALRNPQVIILALACFCYITNSVGLSSWLPTIVRAHFRAQHDAGHPHLGHSVALRHSRHVPHRVALGQNPRAAMAHRDSAVSRRDCAVAEHRGRQQSGSGDRRVLGGDHGALLVPVAVLGVAHALSQRPGSGGEYRADQRNGKSRGLRRALPDWLPGGHHRGLHRGVDVPDFVRRARQRTDPFAAHDTGGAGHDGIVGSWGSCVAWDS